MRVLRVDLGFFCREKFMFYIRNCGFDFSFTFKIRKVVSVDLSFVIKTDDMINIFVILIRD